MEPGTFRIEIQSLNFYGVVTAGTPDTVPARNLVRFPSLTTFNNLERYAHLDTSLMMTLKARKIQVGEVLNHQGRKSSIPKFCQQGTRLFTDRGHPATLLQQQHVEGRVQRQDHPSVALFGEASDMTLTGWSEYTDPRPHHCRSSHS